MQITTNRIQIVTIQKMIKLKRDDRLTEPTWKYLRLTLAASSLNQLSRYQASEFLKLSCHPWVLASLTWAQSINLFTKRKWNRLLMSRNKWRNLWGSALMLPKSRNMNKKMDRIRRENQIRNLQYSWISQLWSHSACQPLVLKTCRLILRLKTSRPRNKFRLKWECLLLSLED